MRKFYFAMAAILLIGGMTGCSTPNAPKKADPAAPQPWTTAHFAAGRQQAEAFQQAFWQVYQGKNAELLLPFLPQKRSPQQLQDQLKRQRDTLEKRYGRMSRVRYGGEMEKPFVRDYFWITRFEKKQDAAAATIVVTEFLFIVRVALFPDGVKVIGFGLRP